MSDNLVFRELLNKLLDNVDELKTSSAVTNEKFTSLKNEIEQMNNRLDRYNDSLEQHMAQTMAVREIAEAAQTMAANSCKMIETQWKRIDEQKDIVKSLDDSFRTMFKVESEEKETVKITKNIFTTFKYLGYFVAAITPIVAAIWTFMGHK